MTKLSTTRSRRLAAEPNSGPSAAVQGAARAAEKVRLLDVGFAGIEARLVDAPTGDAPSLGFEVRPCEGRWVRENDELRVLLPYSVHLNASANGSTRELAIVAVTMRLTYRLLDKEIGDDVLEAFAAISPFMHSWPYLRATVQELTTKLGLPPLLLPVAVSGHAEQIVRMKALGRAEHGPRPKRAKGSKS